MYCAAPVDTEVLSGHDLPHRVAPPHLTEEDRQEEGAGALPPSQSPILRGNHSLGWGMGPSPIRLNDSPEGVVAEVCNLAKTHPLVVLPFSITKTKSFDPRDSAVGRIIHPTIIPLLGGGGSAHPRGLETRNSGFRVPGPLMPSVGSAGATVPYLGGRRPWMSWSEKKK